MSSNAPGSSKKRRQIVEAVRDRIKSGDFRPGDRIPSDAELVKEFGVSRPTVAKALQELQETGLVKRKAGSGTFVLRSPVGGNMQFGLLIPGLGQTEIFEPICAQMACAASNNGHSILWGAHSRDESSSSEGEWALDLCRHYVEIGVAGVFFAPLEYHSSRQEINEQIVCAFREAKIPTVLLDRDYVPYPARSSLDLVGIDNRRVGYVVTHHMFQQGCKRVVFLSRPNSASTIDERIAGFMEAVVKDSGEFNNDLIMRCEPSDTDHVEQLLKSIEPDGIICGNDVTAANLLHSLDRLKIKVPDTIRVAGVDDVKYAALLHVPLTSVRQPCDAIGEAAYHTMLFRLQYPDAPVRSIILPSELVPRKSSEAL